MISQEKLDGLRKLIGRLCGPYAKRIEDERLRIIYVMTMQFSDTLIAAAIGAQIQEDPTLKEPNWKQVQAYCRQTLKPGPDVDHDREGGSPREWLDFAACIRASNRSLASVSDREIWLAWCRAQWRWIYEAVNDLWRMKPVEEQQARIERGRQAILYRVEYWRREWRDAKFIPPCWLDEICEPVAAVGEPGPW